MQVSQGGKQSKHPLFSKYSNCEHSQLPSVLTAIGLPSLSGGHVRHSVAEPPVHVKQVGSQARQLRFCKKSVDGHEHVFVPVGAIGAPAESFGHVRHSVASVPLHVIHEGSHSRQVVVWAINSPKPQKHCPPAVGLTGLD